MKTKDSNGNTPLYLFFFAFFDKMERRGEKSERRRREGGEEGGEREKRVEMKWKESCFGGWCLRDFFCEIEKGEGRRGKGEEEKRVVFWKEILSDFF